MLTSLDPWFIISRFTSARANAVVARPASPMICRMHGIAHELKRPDGTRILGIGCHLFEKTCKSTSPKRFNRTPFYHLVAELEKKLRKTAGLQTKIKMTIAEMIEALDDPYPYVAVRINNRLITKPDFNHFQVPDGSKIFLIPLISGG